MQFGQSCFFRIFWIAVAANVVDDDGAIKSKILPPNIHLFFLFPSFNSSAFFLCFIHSFIHLVSVVAATFYIDQHRIHRTPTHTHTSGL